MDGWHFIAERKIREAMEEGAFDHLEGAGRPLPLEENPFEDPSLRMAHRILKNNGLTPAWIQEAKELERETRRLLKEGDRAGSGFGDRAAELNRRIRDFNLRAPLVRLHKRPIEIR